MPKTLDLYCIGESLRDIFYFISEATVSCSLEKERCLLCMEYAEKIPVADVIKVPAAGNSSNAAVTASRLGLRSGIQTWIGQDPAGEDMQKALKKDGVDISRICIDKNHPTNEATILSFKGERTQLLFFKPRTYKLLPFPKTRAVYYSAMGNGFAGFDRALATALNKQPKLFFAFQPGTTHVRKGLKPLLSLIKRSDLFILNKEEAAQILGDGERPIKNLLEHFHQLSKKTVVITDGKAGAYAYDGEQFLQMPIFPGDAKERTGAGDAFASALVCALLKNLSLEEALRWGTANSWSVVRETGPQAGILTATQMKKILSRFKKIKAKQM